MTTSKVQGTSKKVTSKKKAAGKKKAAAKPKQLSFKKATEAYKGPLKIERKLSTLVRGVWHLRGTVIKVDATTGKKVKN